MNQTQSNLGWTTRKVKGKSGRIRVSPLYVYFFFWFAYMHVYFLSLYVFCTFQLFAFFLSQLFFIRIPPPPLFREIFIIAVQNFERFSMKKKLKSSVMRLRCLPSHSLQIKANQISPGKQNDG